MEASATHDKPGSVVADAVGEQPRAGHTGLLRRASGAAAGRSATRRAERENEGRRIPALERATSTEATSTTYLPTEMLMRLKNLKLTWYLATAAGAFSAVAVAQSPPSPTGDGPTWAWMAAIFLLLLLGMGKWIFHQVNKDIARVELRATEVRDESTKAVAKVEAANTALRTEVENLRRRVTEEHLDRDATKELIQMVVKIAVADQMKLELQTVHGQLNTIVLALANMVPQHHNQEKK